ncbi:hypothetical protein BD410DRAFT_845895 [Rickenella mellea]|uniref:Uncharacterized protein n=1 Tax=Rickenella mellea TaxID=50990 RepID=A0A4Y7PJI5_9AGAM|nr:hypothetical protein BD410DRAFT_845895 [Rickenella mellea]
MTPSPLLPMELWRRIFRLATSSGVEPDRGFKLWFTEHQQNHLDMMETKIAISLVSRRFRRIASEFLFEFVHVDKPSHALKLEIMMKESSTSELGPRDWFKFLFVTCTDASITPKVANALRLCRGLRGFSWNHPGSRTRKKPSCIAFGQAILPHTALIVANPANMPETGGDTLLRRFRTLLVSVGIRCNTYVAEKGLRRLQPGKSPELPLSMLQVPGIF